MKIQLKLFEIRSINNNELYKDVLSAMAYNKVALKRLVLRECLCKSGPVDFA